MTSSPGDGHGRWTADARCPLRPGEPCTLCHPEAHGPQDCPTVALVMDDPELRAELARRRTATADGPAAG
ncbi:MAG: hypothetical protein P8Z68_00285 [Kineosporiaceae bacterium]